MFDRDRDRIACKPYEARLANLLDSTEDRAADEELAAHLERCPACQEALETSRLGRELLQQRLEPACEPDGAFATRVLAAIREEEGRRLQFWRPFEVLASRLALTAALVLLVLGLYVYEGGPVRQRVQDFTQIEVSEGFPELGGQPPSQDEILGTLGENGNGR